MVYRIFVEKKPGFAIEAEALKNDILDFLKIKHLTEIRIIQVYDIEGIDEEIFDYISRKVLSDPQTDRITKDIKYSENDDVFAVEYLPGQYDQKADAAEECIALISGKDKPIVKTKKVYVLKGALTRSEIDCIKSYIINNVESREISLEKPETLKVNYPVPEDIEILERFNNLTEIELMQFEDDYGLAMDVSDLKFCQEYFKGLDRAPTVTEIKVIDTYWSDHCRHTTFNTIIDDVKFEDDEIHSTYEEYIKVREEIGRTKPITLMDVGTIAAKALKKKGMLDKLDESDEINACTVKIKARMDGEEEDWLLLFKNETHNHPTEIEPFGGASTCVGGAIRDPLSGRSYAYAAMRVTGAGNPLTPFDETLKGKLPQRKLVQTAAAGNSSYGNQIGLAGCLADEIYHPGYVAKRMEVGAIVAAAPKENVVRETPKDGDVVILLGGHTGRDGCGGATGASKSHTVDSLETCGAEVQKGNPPEERKIQRLFRNPEASKLIIRCNDFGAGGVSVAIGELADGLDIDLDQVTVKYEGLDGTELAISESQERMAVVVHAKDEDKFIGLAEEENLEATKVAVVTEEPTLKISWRGKNIVNISREFLDTNGTEKHTKAFVPKHNNYERKIEEDKTFSQLFEEYAEDLNICSKKGIGAGFDSTAGGGTVLMPYGGSWQKTPVQAMVNLIPSVSKTSKTCSMMAWGHNPFISTASPYHGGYFAVIESVSKLIATGAKFEDIYLSFQEYFEKLGNNPTKWGKPLSAVLGAFKAQKDLGIAAIGGKDSMSGTFEEIDVPPTLMSFAVTTEDVENIISPEFKDSYKKIYMIIPEKDEETGLPLAESLKDTYRTMHRLIAGKKIVSAYSPCYGGAAEAVLKMCIGNGLGFAFNKKVNKEAIFGYNYGSFIIEPAEGLNGYELDDFKEADVFLLGNTTPRRMFNYGKEAIFMDKIVDIYENRLESVYSCNRENEKKDREEFSYEAETRVKPAKTIETPKVIIPVFPGTNGEYEAYRAFLEAGANAEIFIVNNMTPEKTEESAEEFAKAVNESNIIFIPGGAATGDEPGSAAAFPVEFLKKEPVKSAVNDLVENRDGLMAGIGNGFQTLLKLGLVPFGKIIDIDETCPTLTLNEIGRLQSGIVRTRIASNKSPWLANTEVGDIYEMPIASAEGKFVASEKLVKRLAMSGQIASQYVDADDLVTDEIQFNPGGSFFAVEAVTSPDGRIIGKMGHNERNGEDLYKNVPGNYDMGMFRAAVDYFRNK